MGAMSLGFFSHGSFPCPLPAERYGPAIADLELLLFFLFQTALQLAWLLFSRHQGLGCFWAKP